MKLEDLLKAELTHVAAPPGLWSRIAASRDIALRPNPRRSWVLAAAALALAALALFQHFQTTEMAMDIQPYLQSSPDFVKDVHGEPVRHVVYNDVSLFIASPKVSLHLGNERWIDQKVGGVDCKRIECPRFRSVEFPCSKQVCVAACKRCSEAALLALMARFNGAEPNIAKP